MQAIIVAIISSAAFSTLFTTLLSRVTRPKVEKKTTEWITALELLEKAGQKPENQRTSLEKTVVNHIEFEIAQATAAAKEPKRGKHTYYEISLYGFLSLLFILLGFLFYTEIDQQGAIAFWPMIGCAVMCIYSFARSLWCQNEINKQLDKYNEEQNKVYELYFPEPPTKVGQATSDAP